MDDTLGRVATSCAMACGTFLGVALVLSKSRSADVPEFPTSAAVTRDEVLSFMKKVAQRVIDVIGIRKAQLMVDGPLDERLFQATGQATGECLTVLNGLIYGIGDADVVSKHADDDLEEVLAGDNDEVTYSDGRAIMRRLANVIIKRLDDFERRN